MKAELDIQRYGKKGERERSGDNSLEKPISPFKPKWKLDDIVPANLIKVIRVLKFEIINKQSSEMHTELSHGMELRRKID